MKNPFVGYEKKVAKRLRAFREMLHFSQREFAERIGVPYPRWASFEDTRAPLRWDTFVRLAQLFGLSARWLAKGEGHPLAPMRPGWEELNQEERMVFFHVFIEHEEAFAPRETDTAEMHLGRLLAALKITDSTLDVLADMSDENRRALLSHRAVALYLQRLAAKASLHGGDAMTETARSGEPDSAHLGTSMFIGAHNRRELIPTSEKESLTTSRPWVETTPMAKRDLNWLLSQVRELTSARGSRKLFAKAVGVTPNRLSDWLAESREPSAQQTLTMLDLVESGWRPKTK